jgi:hypothetical protein
MKEIRPTKHQAYPSGNVPANQLIKCRVYVNEFSCGHKIYEKTHLYCLHIMDVESK